jgi:hypothetical protein
VTAPQVSIPPGMVALTTYGSIVFETHHAIMEMRSLSEKQGLTNVSWQSIPGILVDRARNQAVVQLLKNPQLQWLVFVDGDCVFPPDALIRLLAYAYHENPAADVVGAYNVLRGEPYLPTIDTGTGTWESHFPGSGPLEVMRTGSAFILIKRHVYERVTPPWYGTRHPMRPIDVFAELDNFANQKFDGQNPLAKTPEWQTLYACAKDDASTYRPESPDAFVGEDSNFCDAVKAAGMRIFVHTDIVCGHIEHNTLTWSNHRDAMEKAAARGRQACGLQR